MFQQNLNAMSSTIGEAILFFKTQLEAYEQTLTKMEKDLSFTTTLLEGVNNLENRVKALEENVANLKSQLESHIKSSATPSDLGILLTSKLNLNH